MTLAGEVTSPMAKHESDSFTGSGFVSSELP